MTIETNRANLQLFGLHEVDRTGTILYSRPYESQAAAVLRPSVVGRNFFDEVTAGENAEYIRRHFMDFLNSHRSVDSFIFEDAGNAVPVKIRVLMTRGRETRDDNAATGIVIMDIKKYII